MSVLYGPVSLCYGFGKYFSSLPVPLPPTLDDTGKLEWTAVGIFSFPQLGGGPGKNIFSGEWTFLIPNILRAFRVN